MHFGCERSIEPNPSTEIEKLEQNRLPIEGRWRDDPFDVVIADGRIETFLEGEPYEYPNGEVFSKEPGVLGLRTESGSKEIFVYEWDGERLAMMFQRGGPVYCVPVDTVARENAKLLKKKPNRVHGSD